MKIRPVGAEFFCANLRTNMTKLIVVFRSFAKAPQNSDNSNNSLLQHVNFWRGLKLNFQALTEPISDVPVPNTKTILPVLSRAFLMWHCGQGNVRNKFLKAINHFGTFRMVIPHASTWTTTTSNRQWVLKCYRLFTQSFMYIL